MRIGIGGGAASSMATGANTAELDFDSVQRGNPEMERRAQEVINAAGSWATSNPILSIHDVGAGGLSNAFPDWSTARARRAVRAAQGASSKRAGCRRAKSGRTSRRSATCSRSRRPISPTFDAICERERCPFAVVGARDATSAS